MLARMQVHGFFCCIEKATKYLLFVIDCDFSEIADCSEMSCMMVGNAVYYI